MKIIFQTIFIFFILGTLQAQYPVDTIWIPTAPDTMGHPPYLKSVYEKDYEIDLTRVSDATAFGFPNGSGELLAPYAKTQAWNADMTKIFIGYTNVLNADDYSIYKSISGSYSGGYYSDGRWSNVDPEIRYFCWEDRFMKINIETEEVDTLAVFPGYDARIGPFEGNVSADDKYVVVTDFSGNNATLYDIELDIILASKSFAGSGFDWASITPSNDYIAVSNNTTGRLELYDLSFNYLRDVTGQQHGDFAIDTDGNEVFAQVVPLSMIRLDNGAVTDLLPSGTVCGNYSFNPSITGHVSGRNLNQPGWALVSTPVTECSNGMGYYYITEMFAVKLDGSGTIRNYGHAYSSSATYDSYPKASVSPDGKKVMFSSDWDLYGDGFPTAWAYIAELHQPIDSETPSFSDEFDKTCSGTEWKNVNTTEGWNTSHLEIQDVNISNTGELTLMPYTTAWYANYRSNLMYKEVASDFVFTTHVSATNRAEDDIPSSLYSLAGAMIRTPKTMTSGLPEWNAGEENYVFLSLGFASTNHSSCNGCPGPHFEVKNTINSNSSLNVSSIDTAAAIIRIIKIDDAIVVMNQVEGQSFQVVQRYSRPDMPDTLQVGLVAYTDWSKAATYTAPFLNSHTINSALNPDPSSNPGIPFSPDIIAHFDYARFEAPQIPAYYVGRDFSDPAQVSDAQIISIFGYASEDSGLPGWKIWQGTDNDWSNPSNWVGGVPTTQDSVLIPNCNCPEVIFPTLTASNLTFSSLKIESGGELTISSTGILNVDLMGISSRFINEGIILNEGELNLIHSQNKPITNIGTVSCSGTGQIKILE